MLTYRFFLSIHILGVISWMAGILYLYRLFVNHREQGFGNEVVHALLSGMEYRLFRYITAPAMGVAVIAGGLMLWYQPSLWSEPWFEVKFAFGGAQIAATLFAKQYLNRFALCDNKLPTARTFRLLNEVPTIFMIIIVLMAIMKPSI